MRLFCLIVFNLLNFLTQSTTTVVLEENGYTNILVAISDEIDQPDDGGFTILANLMNLMTETSSALFVATNNRVYFNDIYILIPSKWNLITAFQTRSLIYDRADIRLTLSNSLTSNVPYTLHSGKCGVGGDYVHVPVDYLMDPSENIKVKAKAMVQQWSQFRYGVFEEHGYPGDDLLPYFYRHPDGYDAVTSSNNTFINGDLLSLSGDECEVDENGVISNQDDCRFVPTNTGQSATSSLMSFYWLDSVVSFSDEKTYDRRPPHRQNRLCGSRSSSEVVFQSPDLINTTPTNQDQITVPRFRFVQNKMLPLLYLAIDKSKPSNPDNAGQQGLNILKGALRRLMATFESYPDAYVGWSTFENSDYGVNDYLVEEVAPIRYADGKNIFEEFINNFTFSSNVTSRDVSAVVRDAQIRLHEYKDSGGSILYVITSTDSTTNDTVTETEMADKLLANNIKLMVAESGLGAQGLGRFSVLSQGSYYFATKWDTTAFFTPIKDQINGAYQNGLKNERRVIISKKGLIKIDSPWEGSFSIDETVGTNTTVTLVMPSVNGSFQIIITSPNDDNFILENNQEDTNWNSLNSEMGIMWIQFDGHVAVGTWNYTILYDPTSCTDCETEPEIHLQIGSSVSSETFSGLQTFRPWVSLTAGSKFVDLSQHPAVIQARFESSDGRLGGLNVNADVALDGIVVASVSLTDTGTMSSDISNDGIYSGIFYPDADGTYTINFYAKQVTETGQNNKILNPHQNSSCCGSVLPTVILEYFQSTIHEAMRFEVRNSLTASQETALAVSDLRANTYGIDEEKVYVDLTWTVPINTIKQVVRYSESYDELLDDFENALQAEVIYGSLENTEPGTSIFVYVSTPYHEGENVYFIVETTSRDNLKARSHLVWAEPYPPENPFTPPMSTTMASSTGSTVTNLTTLNHTTITDSTTTRSTITDSSTDQSTITDSSTDQSTITDSSTDQSTITSSSTIQSTLTDITSTTIRSSSQSSTDASESTTPFMKPPDDGLSAAQISFIVGGILIICLLIIAVYIYIYRRRRTGHSEVKVDPGFNDGIFLVTKKQRAFNRTTTIPNLLSPSLTEEKVSNGHILVDLTPTKANPHNHEPNHIEISEILLPRVLIENDQRNNPEDHSEILKPLPDSFQEGNSVLTNESSSPSQMVDIEVSKRPDQLEVLPDEPKPHEDMPVLADDLSTSQMAPENEEAITAVDVDGSASRLENPDPSEMDSNINTDESISQLNPSRQQSETTGDQTQLESSLDQTNSTMPDINTSDKSEIENNLHSETQSEILWQESPSEVEVKTTDDVSNSSPANDHEENSETEATSPAQKEPSPINPKTLETEPNQIDDSSVAQTNQSAINEVTNIPNELETGLTN